MNRFLVGALTPALLVLGGPAQATGCPFISDVTGDVLLWPSPDPYDLVSADIVTDDTTVTAVFRVQDLTAESLLTHQTVFSLAFHYRSTTAWMRGVLSPTGTAGSFVADDDTAPGGANTVYGTVTVDTTTDEVRVSAVHAGVPAYAALTDGTVLDRFRAMVYAGTPAFVPPDPIPREVVGPFSGGPIVDDQRTTDTYTAGDSACITV